MVKAKGYSLIELVVTIGIGSILLTALLQLFVGGVRSLTSYSEKAEALQNSNLGVEVMLRDIRVAGFDPSATSGASLIEASSNRLRFSADLNGDGDVYDSGEDVTYGVVDVDHDGVFELGRSVDGGSSYDAVVGGVKKLHFSYLLEDGTRSDSVILSEEVRSVAVELVCSVHSKPEETVTASGMTRVRNLSIADE